MFTHRTAHINKMQELTVNTGKRGVPNSTVFTSLNREGGVGSVYFFAVLFSKVWDYWIGNVFFPMWEKVIQAVNSGVSLSEDSAFVNTCSLDLFQDQPDRSRCPCQCARLPVTKPYFFQYLCFYQRIYFSKPVLRWDSLSCLFYPRTSVEDYCRSVCVPMIQPSTLLRQKTVLAKI